MLIWWILIILSFLISFIGIVMPVIPGVPFIWLGFAIYHYAISPLVGWQFWLTMLLFSALIFIVDFVASGSWVKKRGGSKQGAWAAVLGMIIGPLMIGPLGVIIGPFVLVITVEMMRGVQFKKAIQIGTASLIGLLGGSIVKVILQMVMIVLFIFRVID